MKIIQVKYPFKIFEFIKHRDNDYALFQATRYCNIYTKYIHGEHIGTMRIEDANN